MATRILVTACSILLAASSALALPVGDVLVVDDDPGPGVDHGEIQSAVDAAADGDVVLVRPGLYEGFTVDGLGLSVLADPPGGAQIVDTITVSNTTAAQDVLLRGLTVSDPAPDELRRNGLRVTAAAGPVWIEDCDLSAVGFNPALIGAARVEDGDAVTFLRCTFTGRDGGLGAAGETGLVAVDSNVSAWDCAFTGGDGTMFPGSHPIPPASPGGAGARIDGGTFFASGCAFDGGRGANGARALGPCQDGGDGGHGLHLVGAAPLARRVDCTGSGGDGGWPGQGCSEFGTPGNPIQVDAGTVLPLGGNARSLQVQSPVREGGLVTLQADGVPGDLVIVLLAVRPAPPLFLREHLGSLLLDPTLTIVVLGSVPATGPYVLDSPVPTLNPALSSAQVWLQLLARDTGGQLFLGGGSGLVVVDAAF